jgi:hypothetical protein
MSVSRRRFLQGSAMAAAACTAAPLHAWNNKKPALDGEINHIRGPHGVSRQDFERIVGSSFKVSPTTGNAGTVWLRLLAVDDLPDLEPVNTGIMSVPPKTAISSVSTTGFMLRFTGPGTRLPQGTYAFEHAGLGKFALLIVPGGPGLGTYTAVFNLLSGTTAPVHHR